MTEHQKFEELANEFKPASPRIDPEETVVKLQTAFAAAETYQQAANEASRYGDEDDCRLLAELSETVREQLAVFCSLIRERCARPWQPDPAAAEAAEVNALIEELQKQYIEASVTLDRLQILITYLSGDGEELNAGDLADAQLIGPYARDLPTYVANLGYGLQCPGRALSAIATTPGLATLETRIANRPCDA